VVGEAILHPDGLAQVRDRGIEALLRQCDLTLQHLDRESEERRRGVEDDDHLLRHLGGDGAQAVQLGPRRARLAPAGAGEAAGEGEAAPDVARWNRGHWNRHGHRAAGELLARWLCAAAGGGELSAAALAPSPAILDNSER
ncbi:MAG TPA: hypothetical protein VHM02_15715, partial [Thermoanaerobaculia bacterium]|nr:hypothetical protein [Thermoanaerobaculia bacterium]